MITDPGWMLVYEILSETPMTFVPRPRNLPAKIEGDTIAVCGRRWYKSVAETPLPEGRVVAVHRLGGGRFEYYQLKEEEADES